MNMKRKESPIMFNTLLSLSDNDKKLIFSLLLIIILVIALIGLLGYILVRLMKWQGKKIDTLIHDVVVTKVITDRKHLVRYGRYKNWALFFKQTYISVLILLVGVTAVLIHNAINNDWSYNPFSTYDGFGTLFFTWKISGDYVGGTIVKFAKLVVDNTPHVDAIAWAGYIFGPCLLVGGGWYVVSAASLLARTIFLYKRSREVFEKSLEGYRQNETLNINNNQQ